MRNKNVFIRKETAFSVLNGNGHPVFAMVHGYNADNDTVVYSVNFPVAKKASGTVWRYDDPEYNPPVTYAKSLADFQERFTADVWDEFARYTSESGSARNAA